MHVALADVFMHGIVGDVAHGVARPIALGIEILRVVIHVGEQCVARQALVPAGKPGVGQCGLKLRAVLPGPRKSIFQRQAERRRRSRSSLLHFFCGCRVRGSRGLLRRGNPCAAQQNGSNQRPRQHSNDMRFHESRLLSRANAVHGGEESNVTKRR